MVNFFIISLVLIVSVYYLTNSYYIFNENIIYLKKNEQKLTNYEIQKIKINLFLCHC